MVYVAIFWCVCAVGTTISAVQRHRNGPAWFLLGLALGPISLLIVSAAMDGAQIRQERDLRAGKIAHCPACLELINAAATRCRHCGAGLTPRAAPAGPHSQEQK